MVKMKFLAKEKDAREACVRRMRAKGWRLSGVAGVSLLTYTFTRI